MTSTIMNQLTEIFKNSSPFEFLVSNSSTINLVLIFFTSVTLLIGLFLYTFQSRLIYLPQLPPGSKEEVWLPSRFGYGPGKRQNKLESETKSTETESDFIWEELVIETPDGEKLQAYWIKAPSQWTTNEPSSSGTVRARNVESNVPFTVLYMQANAGNIGHRLPIAKKFQEVVDCNVLLLSYRGYGKSTGTPSERGLKIDSQTALDYVWNNKLNSPVERSKLIVYGQSIGGAVAINLAHSNPSKIRHLILENTFLSIPHLIPRVAPVLTPFACLCNQKWNSYQLVSNLSQKILFLAGKEDELVPPDHMVKLHTLAKRSCLKKLVTFPKGTHNDTCIQDGYFEAIGEFLDMKTPVARVTVEEITDEDDQ